MFDLFVPAAGSPKSGLVIMWAGSIIPEGWVLCDGSNNTPDLRNKFVLSIGNSHAYKQQGGYAQIIPFHNHTVEVSYSGAHSHSVSTDNHSHSHSLTYSSSGSHSHTVRVSHSGGGNGAAGAISRGSVIGSPLDTFAIGGVPSIDGQHSHDGLASQMYWASGHTHSFSSGQSGSHYHTYSNSNYSGLNINNNLPPYYKLAYLMYVG